MFCSLASHLKFLTRISLKVFNECVLVLNRRRESAGMSDNENPGGRGREDDFRLH